MSVIGNKKLSDADLSLQGCLLYAINWTTRACCLVYYYYYRTSRNSNCSKGGTLTNKKAAILLPVIAQLESCIPFPNVYPWHYHNSRFHTNKWILNEKCGNSRVAILGEPISFQYKKCQQCNWVTVKLKEIFTKEINSVCSRFFLNRIEKTKDKCWSWNKN